MNISAWGELSAHAFLEDHPSDSDLETGVCRKILNLMYDAVRKGSEYAAAMFRNLYKTYYKKEYDQLKRFRTLSALEVLSLSEDEEKKHFHLYYGQDFMYEQLSGN